MKNIWLFAAVGALLGLMLLKKDSVSDKPVLVITWLPDAHDPWDEGKSDRDYTLESIGFPHSSVGVDGDVEWIEVDAPVAALEAVVGTLKYADGVKAVAIA